MPYLRRSGKAGVPKRVASLSTLIDAAVLELGGDRPIHRCARLIHDWRAGCVVKIQSHASQIYP